MPHLKSALAALIQLRLHLGGMMVLLLQVWACADISWPPQSSLSTRPTLTTASVIVLTEKGLCQGAYLSPGVVISAAHCHHHNIINGVLFDTHPVVIKKIHRLLSGSDDKYRENPFTPEEARRFYPATRVLTHPQGNIALIYYEHDSRTTTFAHHPMAVTDIPSQAKPHASVIPHINAWQQHDHSPPHTMSFIKGQLMAQNLMQNTKQHLTNYGIPSSQLIFLADNDYRELSPQKFYLCSGDSGGPVFWQSLHDNRWYLVGLVSHAIKNHTEFQRAEKHCSSLISVTPIAHYLPWIRSSTR